MNFIDKDMSLCTGNGHSQIHGPGHTGYKTKLSRGRGIIKLAANASRQLEGRRGHDESAKAKHLLFCRDKLTSVVKTGIIHACPSSLARRETVDDIENRQS